MTPLMEHFGVRSETDFFQEEAFARYGEFDADCALSPGFSAAAEEDRPPNVVNGLHGVVDEVFFVMTMLQRCQRFLKQHDVCYAHSIHAPAFTARDIASAERVPAHEMTKVVVYFGVNGYGMLVLPADCSVDFAEVRRLLGLGDIRLAAEAELLGLFPDCEVGAMPPFGNLFSIPVLVDERIAISEFIAFNAGTHRDVIRMSVSDFASLVNPLVAAFSNTTTSPSVVRAAK